jgi:hypothetical protein
MAYKILPYTVLRAKKIGVIVRTSKNKKKKIDVFKDGKKVGSVGAIGYKDYPTYMRLENQGKVPTGTATKKRRAYKKRHENYRHKKWTNSWLADQLLW